MLRIAVIGTGFIGSVHAKISRDILVRNLWR